MTGLSEQQLAEIQERVLNATPGPWELYEDYGKNFYANVRGEMLLPVGSIEFGDGDTADADRALVEHAAEDLALLLVEVEQLTALLETRARFAELAERRYEFIARFGQRKIKEAEGRREYGKKLEARVAELEAERHSTNEALSKAAETIRAKDQRIKGLEARLFQVGMARRYRLESGKDFVYVEDIRDAVLGVSDAEAGEPRG